MTAPEPSSVAASRGNLALRVGLVVAVVAGLLVAYELGVFQRFSDPAAVKAWLTGLGATGYLAFVLAYTVLQPFGVPGTVFIMAAPLIWSWPVAFALSMAGTMAASVVGFSFARFVARDWISRRIPERFRRYDAALASRGFQTVFWLRLIFWMPPMLHAFFGVSQIRFWTHFWGSLVGYLLPLFLVSYFGHEFFRLMTSLPLWAWLAALAVIAAALVVVLLRNRRKRART